MDELAGLADQVRRTEGAVLEMAALSSLFATHVQQQATQIEALYTQAIESTKRIESGNVELRKTIARRGGRERRRRRYSFPSDVWRALHGLDDRVMITRVLSYCIVGFTRD